MNDNKEFLVPYYIVECISDRLSVIIKRLWILCIILIVLLVGSNTLWLWYESQFEETTTTQEVEQDIDLDEGDVNVVGIGDMYGKDKADSKNND